MPVVLNEPLSFLQRLCEYMEYAHILNLASHQENAADRMKFIAGKSYMTYITFYILYNVKTKALVNTFWGLAHLNQSVTQYTFSKC